MNSFKRPLPLILIADTSGSMKEHGKIKSLNVAIYEMIQSLKLMQKDEEVLFLLTVIGFERGTVKEFFHAENVETIKWCELQAKGVTPLNDAFLKAAELIEQEDVVPKNAYAPILLLVSDGQPTDAKGHLSDDWRESLHILQTAKRVSKGMRFAMAIGPDANEEMLAAFSGNGNVFQASDGEKIRQFFQLVTMATSMSLGIRPVASVQMKAKIQDFVGQQADKKESSEQKNNSSSTQEEKSVTIIFDDDPII